MKTLLLIILNLFINTTGGKINKSFTLDSLGACQGITTVNSNVYAYGDRQVGVIREYDLEKDSLIYTGTECLLTVDGQTQIKHPTGIAYADGKAFIGNSVRSKENPKKWIAEIYLIDWNRMLVDKTLDNSLIRRIEDDLAIQGTRPEYVQYQGIQYVATADYGPENNEVRLYDPKQLAKADKTSDAGVLIAKFNCGAWVQNLHWIEKENTLVLIQNQIEGLRWRLTFVDLLSSIQSGKAEIIKIIDFDKKDELEGFCLLNDIDKAIAVTSSRTNNAHFIELNK